MKANKTSYIFIWMISLLFPLFSCDDCMRQYVFPKWIEITEGMYFKVKDNVLCVDTNAGVARYPILEYDEKNNRYFVDKELVDEEQELLSQEYLNKLQSDLEKAETED